MESTFGQQGGYAFVLPIPNIDMMRITCVHLARYGLTMKKLVLPLIIIAIAACTGIKQGHPSGGSAVGEYQSTSAIQYIRSAVLEYPIVCITEGSHAAKQPHQFLNRVLGDAAIRNTVDVIIVEFATAQHQAVLDAYIRGDDVPFNTLANVWRDTGQSPIGPWDSPLFYQMLQTIREGNRDLPPERRIRVLAGDPYIDWQQITTRQEFNAARKPRDPYVANLAIKQAFHLNKKVLIIYGGAHLPRVPIALDDGRNSLTSLILSQYPDAVKAISFLDPHNLNLESRIGEFKQDTMYSTQHHWVGEINGGFVFPEIFSLITDPDSAEQSWQQVKLYTQYQVRDLFDALIYIGPSTEWEHVPGAYDLDRDTAYLAELNRRSMLRFGRPFASED